MSKYVLFEFTPEIIERFREQREIPVHFYNKDGQILIYRKEEASDSEIDRLLRFVHQGIYYDIEDTDTLGLNKKKKEVETKTEGLSDVKLMGETHAQMMTEETTDLFQEIRKSSLSSSRTQATRMMLHSVFNDFESHPHAMDGLVNIIELMGGSNAGHEVEVAVKRTVVAMAMKTRGMKASSFRDQRKLDDLVNVTMMSALLCDIGQSKMKMPEGMGLSVEEYDYVKNHPLMSYMMLAHEPEIDPRVKRNVLCHHRPLRGSADAHTNNYPDYKSLIRKLTALEEKYRAEPQRVNVANDIREQLSLLKADIPYDEDANILAVASEFASLTSKVPWRDAYSTDEAVRIMINNSYFTYSDRIVREFLDHVVMSLNENRKIIQEGNYIIVAAKGSGKTFFEVCLVTASNRYQSRPGIDRIATIYPEMGRSPKLKFLDFNLDKLRPDPRYAHYELDKDDSRHIVYYIHPQHDAKMYEKLVELTRGRPRRAGDSFVPPGQTAEAATSSESG